MEVVGIIYKFALAAIGIFFIYQSTLEEDPQQVIILRVLGSLMLLMLFISMFRTLLK